MWFAGVHSDVGGTYPDDPRLSTIALKWMLEGAVESGLLVDERAVGKAFAQLTTADAAATAHRNGWAWSLLFPRTRPVPAGCCRARERARAHAPDARLRAPHERGAVGRRGLGRAPPVMTAGG